MRDYAPFEFKGQLVPAAEDLPQLLRSDPGSVSWLVPAAIGHPGLADALEVIAIEWLGSAFAPERRLALDIGRSLGFDSVARELVERLANQPDRWFGGVDEDAIGVDATRFCLAACHPGSDEASQIVTLALGRAETRVFAWRALDNTTLHLALPWVRPLLVQRPDLAHQVASTFALLARDLCPQLCEHLVGIDDDTRDVVGAALQKSLKKMGKIRLWVHCRRALYGR